MNKSILASALLTVAMSGCTPATPEQIDANNQVYSSEKIYRVQLLNGGGGVIREWIALGDVRHEGNSEYFKEKDTGKYIRVSGIVIVEQL